MESRLSQHSAPTLLFVEDDYNWIFTFRDEFQKLAPQWEIMHTREGWTAMHKLAKGLAPQALVIDVDMAGVGCRDLIEWVKEQAQLRDLPIVVLSNSNDSTHRRRFATLGVNSYLDKPGSLEKLRQNIQYIVKLCEESRFRAQEDRKEMACI